MWGWVQVRVVDVEYDEGQHRAQHGGQQREHQGDVQRLDPGSNTHRNGDEYEQGVKGVAQGAPESDAGDDSGEAAQALRDRYSVGSEDFAVLLIGKDGGVKRRAGLNTDLSEIFLQIDGMPMRQQEMRAKQKAGIEVTPP